MALPSGDFVQARVYYRAEEGLQSQLVLWFFSAGVTGDPADVAQELATDIDTNLGGQLKLCIGGSCFYDGTSVALHVGGVVYNAQDAANGGPGAEMSDALPEYCAVVIQKRTAFPGRSGFGRWFIGAVPESFTDGGILNGGGITAYENLMDELLADRTFADGEFTSALFSQKGSALHVLTRCTLDHQLFTQRRRLVHRAI